MLTDLTPRKPAILGSLPAAGTNPNSVFQTANHLYYDDGSYVWQLDRPGNPNLATFTGATATAALTDNLIVGNSSSAQTLTIPPNASVAFPVPRILTIGQRGTGQLTIATGAGVTLISHNGCTKLRTQGSWVTAVQVATNVWMLSGDVEPLYFKGTSSNGFQTIAASGFNRVNIDNSVTALGGMTLDASKNIVIPAALPAARDFDVTVALRIVDNSAVRSVGIGVGTTQGDGPDFYWDQNFNNFTTNRKTFQYHSVISFGPGDLVRPFLYSDGASFPGDGLSIEVRQVT